MVKGKGYYKRKNSSVFVKGVDHPNYKDESQKRQTKRNQLRLKSKTRKCPTVFRPTKRYSQEELNKLLKPTKWNPLSIPGADGKEGNARILRPVRSPVKAPEPRKVTNHTFNIEEGNVIVEKSRIVSFFNHIQNAHRDLGTCDNLDIDIVDFKPWGAFVSAIGKCRNCDFKTGRSRLYEEVSVEGKRGRKAAKGNMSLQFTLQDTPIANTEAQLLVAALGVRPGSLNGMQRLGYKAATITKEVGEADLVQKQEYVVNLLKERGVEKPAEVAGLLASAYDVMYSGVFKKSHVTPGTGAQQAVGSCVEQVSGDALILGVDFVNKQCLTASRMKGKGKGPVICGPRANHDNCTATQGREVAIKERDMAARVAEKIYDSSGLVSNHVVTDSDADGVKGFLDARYKIDDKIAKSKWKNKSTKNRPTPGPPETERITLDPMTTWHKDPIHLGWNMARHIQSHDFSANFFGTKSNGRPWNSKELTECKKWLAMDVPTRVDLTVDNLRDHCKGDIAHMTSLADKVACYMYICYSGSHDKCKRNTLAQLTGCKGSAKDKCWFTTSTNLTAPGITKLNFRSDQNDSKFIRKVIAEKLSSKTIDYIARGLTTSNVESAHRCYTKGNPNNRVFYRTAEARLLSSVCRKNNTLLESTKMKYEAGGCPLKEDSGPMEAFRSYQKRREQVLVAKARPEAKKRRKALMDERRKQHALERMKATNFSDYQKFKLDEAKKAHKEAISNNGCVIRTAEIVKNAQTDINKSRNLAMVKKYTAQQKRKKTMMANRAKIEKARVMNDKTLPEGLSEHAYGVIPGVPTPGTSKKRYILLIRSFISYSFNKRYISDAPLHAPHNLYLL